MPGPELTAARLLALIGCALTCQLPMAMRYYATTWTLSSVRLTATPHDANPVATARIEILSGGQPQISYTNQIILLLLPATFATRRVALTSRCELSGDAIQQPWRGASLILSRRTGLQAHTHSSSLRRLYTPLHCNTSALQHLCTPAEPAEVSIHLTPLVGMYIYLWWGVPPAGASSRASR